MRLFATRPLKNTTVQFEVQGSDAGVPTKFQVQGVTSDVSTRLQVEGTEVNIPKRNQTHIYDLVNITGLTNNK